MKKLIVLALVILAVCLTFAACSCEHQYEEKITTEASCSAVGIKTFTCTKCNDSYTEEIPMIEHSFGTATVTKEPTCTEEGEKSVTCKACGTSKVVETVAKKSHTYVSEITTEATCTEDGINTLTCSVCNNSKEESTNALGHNYSQSNVITKVTCTSNGEVMMTCIRCNDSYNETKKATGHNWKGATCETAKTCSNCNLTDATALGHIWKDATCNTAKTCTRCNKTVGYSLGHSWDKGVITKKPAMYTAGEVVYTCSTCHIKRTETLPAKTPTVNLPATPYIITDSDGNQVKITSLSYTIEHSSIYVDYTYECIAGEDTCFEKRVYDEDGYLIASSTYWFWGEQGTKGKDRLFLTGDLGIYSLELVGK